MGAVSQFVSVATPAEPVGEFFFLIFRREILWEIWREVSRILSDPPNKGSKHSGKISEHFS